MRDVRLPPVEVSLMLRGVMLGVFLIGCATARPLQLITVTTSSAVARAAYERGQLLRTNDAQAKASVEFRAAVAADPQFALAWLYLGWTTSGDESKRALERARELAPGVPEAERVLATAGTRTRSEYAADMRRLAELAPDDWKAHEALASSARYGERDLVTARAAYERALALATDEPGVNAEYATLLSQLGEHDLAIQRIARSVALRPDAPRPLRQQADILFHAGRLDDAALANHKLAQLTGESGEGDDAMIRAFRGDVAGAIALHERALAAPVPERVRGTHQGYRDRAAAVRSLTWLYVLARSPAVVEPAITAVARELEAAGEYAFAIGLESLRAEALLELGRATDAAAAIAAAIAHATTAAPTAVRPLRLTQLRIALAANTPEAERLAAELLAESGTDVAAAQVRLFVAHHRGDAAAALAELARLQSEPEVQPLGKLLAAELLAAAGRTADASRLQREVAATFIPTGRGALLRSRALALLPSR